MESFPQTQGPFDCLWRHSQDTRLWESFPVVLADAAESYQFAPEQVEQQLTQKAQKDLFHRLMLLSGSLFSFYHLSFPWWNKFKKKLTGLRLTKTEQEYYARTVKKKVVALANAELHSLSKKLLGL